MKKYILSAVVAIGMISVPTVAGAEFSESHQMNSGDVNEDVNELQETLKEEGYFQGSTGNTFGPRTLSAVQDFQKDNGISSSAGNFFGVAGPETQAALNDITGGSAESSGENNEATNEGTEEEAETAESTGSEEATETEDSTSEADGESFTMEATAYTANCEGCSGVTATGKDLNEDRNADVVAVDPDVIELGSTVHVEGYGEAVAADVGGDITGERIDLHVPTTDEAMDFGRQDVEVTVVD